MVFWIIHVVSFGNEMTNAKHKIHVTENGKQFLKYIPVSFHRRLHMLCELEHSIIPLFQQMDGDHGKDSLNWIARIEMTQNSYRAKEPILALRRALLSLNKR